MFHLIGDLLLPGGTRGKLIVLVYHRALPEHDPLLDGELDAATFEQHMALLAAEFNVLPLGEACQRLARGALPPRAVAITFDDGYADNATVAAPILKRFGLSATFFVSTGFIAGGAMFNDTVIEAIRNAAAGTYDLSGIGLGSVPIDDIASRRIAVDKVIAALKYRDLRERQSLVAQAAQALGSTSRVDLMMMPIQIRDLHRQGMEIGAHTVNHPILMSIPDDAARSEIVDSKRTLEEIIDSPVTLFAYPNGKPNEDYGPQHVKLVRDAGFAAAVSTIRGVAHAGSDPFQLPRFGPWDKDPRRLGARLLYAAWGRSAAPELAPVQTN